MPSPPFVTDGAAGAGLVRPESVLAHASGRLFASSWRGRGGVDVIDPDGSIRFVEAAGPVAGLDGTLRPNGIALEAGGSFLAAHLGGRAGGIVRLHCDGITEVVVATADGAALPPTNFVVADRAGRLWITVSTRVTPRADDYRAGARTGFVAVAPPGETDARIVADGLGYANECLIDEARGTLYVAETFARRLRAFDLVDADAAGGSGAGSVAGPALANARTVARFGPGTYPDGLALDADGAVLVASIVSNRVLRVRTGPASDPAKDGVDGGAAIDTVFEDVDADHVARAERAWERDALAREHLDRMPPGRLGNVSSLAFGGPDLRTVWLGNLLGGELVRLRAGVPGVPPLHYHHDLGALA